MLRGPKVGSKVTGPDLDPLRLVLEDLRVSEGECARLAAAVSALRAEAAAAAARGRDLESQLAAALAAAAEAEADLAALAALLRTRSEAAREVTEIRYEMTRAAVPSLHTVSSLASPAASPARFHTRSSPAR